MSHMAQHFQPTGDAPLEYDAVRSQYQHVWQSGPGEVLPVLAPCEAIRSAMH